MRSLELPLLLRPPVADPKAQRSRSLSKPIGAMRGLALALALPLGARDLEAYRMLFARAGMAARSGVVVVL